MLVFAECIILNEPTCVNRDLIHKDELRIILIVNVYQFSKYSYEQFIKHLNVIMTKHLLICAYHLPLNFNKQCLINFWYICAQTF